MARANESRVSYPHKVDTSLGDEHEEGGYLVLKLILAIIISIAVIHYSPRLDRIQDTAPPAYSATPAAASQ